MPHIYAALVWAPFANLFVYPVFTPGFWIYHVPYVPELVILAVGGVLLASGLIKRRAGAALPLLLVLVSAWAGYSAYVKLRSRPGNLYIIRYKTEMSDEAMKVGGWGRDALGTNVTYMMEWSRLVYYLGGRWVHLPAAGPAATVRYGAAHNVDYIVEEMRGEEVFAGSRFTGVQGLSLAHIYVNEDVPYAAVFWKLDKGYGRGAGR